MPNLWPTTSPVDLAREPGHKTKVVTKRRARLANLRVARNTVQILSCLVLLYVGWQFYRFVEHFETGGSTPFVARPSLVEGFLPISALVALKHLVVNGALDTVHPAGLVIFLTILTISLLFKKAFCGWFCPAGTLFEWTWRIGQRLLGRNFALPRYVDYPLMALKYLVLAFFIKSIILDMDGAAITAFLNTSYNKVVDVKMMYFFTKMSTEVAVFLLGLLVVSALVKNFWCRYLCPYGALLGLVSYFSPIAVTRDEDLCTDCRLCTRACPNRIDVAKATSVESPECVACLSCVHACPKKGALELRALGKRRVGGWTFAAMLLGVVAVIFLIARITGHWETSLTYADWSFLIPRAESFRHFY
ncbi:MAG: 4Fe-4S binding protein [Chloroflexi bacterium]|nr:4Fe-4S binding protein [Chloroflexota bacterium]